ncbi:MAG: 2-hydroxyglutaryl-CoA dehydratase, partial [candidate division Zixibacteria bacterium]|nr:2-hydroxyglutaryl-CoA dehydratase [candidate division Zixibacteria bacterium]
MTDYNCPLYIGLDIGSVSVNAVVLNDNYEFQFDKYVRIQGRPLKTVRNILLEIADSFSPKMIRTLAVTGSGAGLVVRNFGGCKVNEVIAQAQGILHYYPEVRTIIEMGGEDSKLIILKNGALT